LIDCLITFEGDPTGQRSK